MKNCPKLIGILILIVFGAEGLYSQTLGEPIIPEHNSQSISIFFDNDGLSEPIFKGANEDRNYTMGLGIAYSSTKLNNSFLLWPNQFLAHLIGLRDSLFWGKNLTRKRNKVQPYLVRFPATVMLGKTTFTPDDLSLRVVNSSDRPYSSFLFISTRLHWLNIKENTYHKVSFDIGVHGLFIAREVQTWVHKLGEGTLEKDPVIPQGWSLQISNGGEPTMGIGYELRQLVKSFSTRYRNRSIADIQVGGSINLGHNTYLSTEIMLRVGILKPGSWSNAYRSNSLVLNSDLEEKYLFHIMVDTLFSDSGKKPEERSTTEIGEKKNSKLYRHISNLKEMVSNYRFDDWRGEFFAFASIRSNYVGYNVHLQGQFRDSPYTISASELERVVPEFHGGVGFKIPVRNLGKNSIVGNMGIHWRGREFEKELANNHLWGSINMGLTF